MSISWIHERKTALIVCSRSLEDNPIVAANETFTRLTGFSRSEVIGRNCRLLSGPATEPEKSETLRLAIHGCRPAMVEITNYRRDGSIFLNSVMIAPIFNEDRATDFYVGSLVAVDEMGMSGSKGAAALVDHLSPRQRFVLGAVARGQVNKQIAHDLGLSVRTVKLHRAEILRKLSVSSTVGALRIAFEAGL